MIAPKSINNSGPYETVFVVLEISCLRTAEAAFVLLWYGRQTTSTLDFDMVQTTDATRSCYENSSSTVSSVVVLEGTAVMIVSIIVLKCYLHTTRNPRSTPTTYLDSYVHQLSLQIFSVRVLRKVRTRARHLEQLRACSGGLLGAPGSSGGRRSSSRSCRLRWTIFSCGRFLAAGSPSRAASSGGLRRLSSRLGRVYVHAG